MKRYITIAVVLFIAYIFIVPGSKKTIPVTTTVETVETVISSVDSVRNDSISNVIPEPIGIIERDDGLDIVAAPMPGVETNVKPAYRYRDTTYFQDATIFSEYISEGKIYQTRQKAEVRHKNTVRTVTKTIIKQPGGFYLSPGFDFSPIRGFTKFEVGLTFLKGGFGASAGPYLEFIRTDYVVKEPMVDFGVSVNMHFKL